MKTALVLTGDGINCERETAQAFERVGVRAEIRHLNDLIAEGLTLDSLSGRHSVVALPGGFSFGDDLGSGRVLALKIAHGLKWDLNLYAERGGLVIGICNGFQALIRLGVFGRSLSITSNAGGKFINRWVRLRAVPGKSLWTKGLSEIELPIRHGEGRIVSAGPIPSCLEYEVNPNGSYQACAGLTDGTGRILGLMPHPEAYVRATAHPNWTARSGIVAGTVTGNGIGDGLRIFENAARELKT